MFEPAKLPQEDIIYARELLKCYGEKPVVNHVNFSVRKGECFGILGPNGAGKTTTVRMICALAPPTSGELKVAGLDVREHSREIKKHLGVVSQENTLDPELTVWENLEVFARYFGYKSGEITAHLERLLHMVELDDYRHTRVEVLSGGMKRRLAIARSLVNNPAILVLDEPTTGLDPHARHLLWQQLRFIKQKKITILLTTHYLEEAALLCDRLVFMHGGIILEEGSPRDLVDKHVGQEVLEIGFEQRPELWREKICSSFRDLLKGDRLLGDVLHLYTLKGEELLHKVGLMSPPATYKVLRPANLEDVFLKLTGEELSA